MNKRALIFGLSGQDGAYLARLLLDKGYDVYGSSRDSQRGAFPNLVRLGIRDRVNLESVSPTDFHAVLQALTRAQPDEVYNLAGQSSVGLSFDHPVETFQSIAVVTLNLLEAIRSMGAPIRFFNAGSGDCFADTGQTPANEDTPFRPRSPYAVAKVAAYWQVANYREAYGLHACTGIMFNHESPLRSAHFVTRKIVEGAVKIAGGLADELRLGDISIRRDWGWAPEYVAAMWTMLQQPSPRDYVIATGESHTLEEFVDAAFSTFGLDWHAYVSTDRALFRPSDVKTSAADPSRAGREIGWQARYGMSDVVKMMIEDAAQADGPRGAATGPQ